MRSLSSRMKENYKMQLRCGFFHEAGSARPEGPSRSTQVTRLKKAGEGGWWKGLRACQSNLSADLSSWRERPVSGWSSRSSRAPPTTSSPRRRTGWGWPSVGGALREDGLLCPPPGPPGQAGAGPQGRPGPPVYQGHKDYQGHRRGQSRASGFHSGWSSDQPWLSSSAHTSFST